MQIYTGIFLRKPAKKIYALSATDATKKAAFFERVIAHLKQSPYRYAEVHYYYAEHLLSQKSANGLAISYVFSIYQQLVI